MYRIDTSDAAGSAPAPTALGAEGYFSDGDPSVPTPATEVTPDWLNMVQESLIALQTAASLAHSKTDYTQLLQAIRIIIQNGLAEYGVDAGVADAYVVSPVQQLAAYADGQRIRFRAIHASTGASGGATLAVSGLAALPLVRRDGSNLHQNDIPAGALCEAQCAGGTAFQLMSADVAAVPRDGSAAMTGLLTLFADPTAPFHAATKHYVDTAAAGLHLITVPAKAASTGALTLSGAQTIDGVSCVAGDVVLVKDQAAPAQNGLYVVASGAWARHTLMSTWAEVLAALVLVSAGGTVNGQTDWISMAASGGTLGTDPIPFQPFTPTGHFQPLNALLTALANLSPAAAGKMLYTTGANVWALTALTAFGLSLAGAADANAVRTLLGLGSAALKNTGNSGDVVPLCDGGDGVSPIHFTVDVSLPTTAPTNDYSVGYRGRPGQRQDTDRNIDNGTAGLTLKHGDLTSPVTYTVLDDGAGGCHMGHVTYLRNGPGASTAVIHVVPASDVTLRWGSLTGPRVIAPNGYAELVKDVDAANEWMLRGEGIS